MAEKDVVEKMLEVHNDVFADILNVLVFNGKRVVDENCLVDADRISVLKADDSTLHEMERDVMKYWEDGLYRIASFGIENQTGIDADMPLRVLGYDGASYKSQMLQDITGERKQRYPVITLVLYFGTEREWHQPKSLYERIKVRDEVRPFVNDYHINLFQIAYLSEEQVNLFQSDFGIVADYFVQKRKNRNYVPGRKKIRHVNELLKFMSVMAHDTRFESAYVPEMEKGDWTMCEVLDRLIGEGEARGIALGEARGEARGIENKARIMSVNMYKLGCGLDVIAKCAEYPVSVIRKWIEESGE